MNALPINPTRQRPMTKRPLNFLLVDDDDICLFIHRRVLELTGYCASAHSASNGKTALEILQRATSEPDVILLDLDMPLMNGLRFLEAIQKMDNPAMKRIAIVLLTSSVSEKDKKYAMSLGVSRFLSKPLTRESLDRVVRDLFGSDSPSPLMRANP